MAAALDAAEAWQSVPRVRPPRSLFDSPPAFAAAELDYAFATPRARRKAQPPGNSQTRLHFMPSVRDYEPQEAHPACEACGVMPGEGLCRGCTDFLCRACCLGAKREGRLCRECGLACSSCIRGPERRALAARAREGDGKGQKCRGCATALASPASAARGRTPRGAGEERTPVAASCAAFDTLASGGASGHVGRRRSLAVLAPATESEHAPKRRRR